MNAVEVKGLSRSFGSVLALDRLDLEVPQGQVHGLLGPNGAGKTTLCKILSTVLLPTSGHAAVMGHDVVRDAERVKRSVGIVFGGDRGLYSRLSARQNLRFWGALYGLSGRALASTVDRLLVRVGLDQRAGGRVEDFSRGMKQRLHLARGLIADPPVLLLDEPTLGMDPVAANEFRTLAGELRGAGKTLLLTTHDMAEAEALCDRVTLIDSGRVLISGPPREIGPMMSGYERVEAVGVPVEVLEALCLLTDVISVEARDGRARVETASGEATREVLERLVAAGVTSLRTGAPSLRELYVHLVGGRGMAVRR